MAAGRTLTVSTGILDHDARAALGPRLGNVDGGVPALLYWKPGMMLVSSGEKTAIAALVACVCQ